ncbi:MAG: rod shape-determining protein RodA [Verrucomicrobiae bacterium]|nr:rod shape-determining protein RodA [Verrucomicrobiae bacterium]
MLFSDKVKTVAREVIADFRWHQVFVILALMGLSLLSIYSATCKDENVIPKAVYGQLKWFGIGLALYFFVSLVDYHWFCRKAWFPYLAVLGLLYAVLKMGKKMYGAYRWIEWHGITVQPSEFAKLTVLLLLCHYLSKSMGTLNEWRRLTIACLLFLIPACLINKEPDLGTALVVVGIGFVLLFLAGAPHRFFIYLGAGALCILPLLICDTYRYNNHLKKIASQKSAKSSSWVTAEKTPGAKPRDEAQKKNAPPGFKSILHLKPHQLDRVLVLVAPGQLDPLGKRWNRDQSLIAIGSGGLYGKGWRKGDVTRGGYLPGTVSHNDFIFAVFAEENGFVGGVILTGLYAILLLGGGRIATKAGDSLGMLLAGGITFLLFFHVFVNIGMTLGVLPIVGVPLPLMSYGGSFVVVCMICLGLLQSVWLHRKPY